MSKKLILGLIFGVAAGTAAAFLIKFRNKNKSFLEIEYDDENDMLDKANDYLLLAKNKVESMVKKAEAESFSLLDEAGNILSKVKDSTARVHSSESEEIIEDLEKTNKEIVDIIDKFRKKL